MKVLSGVKKLDDVLNGGFEKGSLSLVMAEGDFSGKTTTLSYLASQAAEAGSKVAFASFDDEVDALRNKLNHPLIKPLTLKSTKLESIQVQLSSFTFNSDVLFIDNLNRLEFFEFNPEAVSVIHNLKLLSKMWNIAIVASVGVLPEHDVIPFLRITDVAFDIEEFHNKTFSLGVLKNNQGKSGFALSFGITH